MNHFVASANRKFSRGPSNCAKFCTRKLGTSEATFKRATAEYDFIIDKGHDPANTGIIQRFAGVEKSSDILES